MAAPLIAAAVQAGQSIWQYAQGEKQKKLAGKLKPGNYLPPGFSEALQRSRMDANASVGPATRRGLERLSSSSASQVNNLRRMGGNPSQIQQGVMDVDAREKETIRDLSVADAAFKADQDRNLQGLLTMKGQYEKESQDAMNATKSALTGASMQNKYNALTSAAEGIIYSLPDKAFDARTAAGATGNTATPSGRTTASAMSPLGAKTGGLTPQQYNRLRQLGLLKGDSRFPQYNRFNLQFESGLQ